MNKKLFFFLVFLCFFVFSLGTIAQEKGVMEVIQEKELMRIQAEEPKSDYIIYVDDATGDDDGKGTENKPYKTIGKALEVAESGGTIKVAQGIYNESLDLRYFGPIIIEGSGKDSCTIDGSIFVDVCDYLKIDGFTITGGGSSRAVWFENVDNAIINDCDIYPNSNAIYIRLHTALWVYDTQIIGDGRGYGAFARAGSYMSLNRCSISGFSIFGVRTSGAETDLFGCEVYNNSGDGVRVSYNAQVYLNGCDIHGNQRNGISVKQGGDLRLYGSNTIHDNTETGIDIRFGGHAELSGYVNGPIDIYGHNRAGINVYAAGILVLRENINIYENRIGIIVKSFSSAFLEEVAISGNIEWDLIVDEGGQAKCNPLLIDKLASECPYC
jgi:hypothetical protein